MSQIKTIINFAVIGLLVFSAIAGYNAKQQRDLVASICSEQHTFKTQYSQKHLFYERINNQCCSYILDSNNRIARDCNV